MDSCDSSVRAYKNGKTFEQCRDIAEAMNPIFKNKILNQGKLSWHEILDSVDHDELVYKLTLRFLRRDGYDIGNNKTPEVKSTL